jgi:hypothetical protein
VLVIEVDIVEATLLDISDFFTDNNLLEIDHRVLNLNIFILEYLLRLLFVFILILTEIVNCPCHVRVFIDHLFNNFLSRVMEINEGIFDVE